MIQYAKHKNHNSELTAFGVTTPYPPWTLLLVIQVKGFKDYLEALQNVKQYM